MAHANLGHCTVVYVDRWVKRSLEGAFVIESSKTQVQLGMNVITLLAILTGSSSSSSRTKSLPFATRLSTRGGNKTHSFLPLITVFQALVPSGSI